MFFIESWDLLPAGLLAFTSLVYALIWLMSQWIIAWQFLQVWLARLGIQGPLGLAIAGCCVVPLWGSAMLLLVLLEIATKPLLAFLHMVTLGGGICLWVQFFLKTKASLRVKEVIKETMVRNWALMLLLVFSAFFAAHPQWLYDQFAYHLVVPKFILLEGSPYERIADMHLFYTGPFEFSTAWLGSLVYNETALVGLVQVYTFLVFLGIVGCVVMGLNTWEASVRSIFSWGLFVALSLVWVYPDQALIHQAKPAGLILAIFMCIFAVLRVFPQAPFLTLAIGLAALVPSLKLTGLAGCLALIPVLLFEIYRSKRLKVGWNPIFTLGVIAFGLTGWFRLKGGATPFFPVDLQLWENNGFAMSFGFWYKDQTLIDKLMGVLTYLGQELYLLPFLGCIIFGIWRQGGIRDIETFKSLFLFLGAFVCIWPFVFWDGVYARFVVPFTAALYLGALFAWLELRSNKIQKVALALLGIAAILHGQLDVKAIRLMRFNQAVDARQSLNEIHPVPGSRFLNAELGNPMVVLSDENTKYFLNHTVVSHAATQRERSYWKAVDLYLKQNQPLPKEVGALMLSSNKPSTDHPSLRLLAKKLEKQWKRIEVAQSILFIRPSAVSKPTAASKSKSLGL